MSLINTEIQPFKATAYHDGEFVEVTNESLKGKWSVVVFMPAAFTFNCPTEVEDAADNYAEFQKAGAEVYIVTTDTHFSHKVWHETSPAVGKARFPLVGDPTHALTRAFGVHIEEVMKEAGVNERAISILYRLEAWNRNFSALVNHPELKPAGMNPRWMQTFSGVQQTQWVEFAVHLEFYLERGQPSLNTILNEARRTGLATEGATAERHENEEAEASIQED